MKEKKTPWVHMSAHELSGHVHHGLELMPLEHPIAVTLLVMCVNPLEPFFVQIKVGRVVSIVLEVSKSFKFFL